MSVKDVVLILVVLAVSVIGVVTWASFSRRGKGGKTVSREQDAGRLGLTYRGKGDKEFRARFSFLVAVPRGASIRHIYEGSLDGRPIEVFQSSYMVSTGQAMVQVSHTIYAVQAPAWPATQIAARNWFGRLVRKFGRPTGLELDNPEFNRRFRFKTDDEDFAIALLSPEMQGFMLSKTSVKWRIASGRLCMLYNGTLKPDRMEASLQRLRQFWSLVPPELESW
jgi:hypothetical protein